MWFLARYCTRKYCSTVPSWTATVWPFSCAAVLIGELAGTTMSYGESLGFAPSVAATTLTGSPADWAKIVGVSAMSPRSTDPPVSAAITGGPPTKLVQSTLYCAPWRASVAAKMVWYSLSWSPKVRVTPLSETVFVAAGALVAPTPSTRLAASPAGSARAATRRIAARGRRVGGVVDCTALPSVVEGRAAAGPVGGTQTRRRVPAG